LGIPKKSQRAIRWKAGSKCSGLVLYQVEYRKYCERKFSKLIGKAAIFDEENEDYAVNKCREMWRKRYPNEPFENEVSDSDNQCSSSYGEETEKREREEMMREMGKQKDVYERYFREAYMGEIMYLIAAKKRYKKMLQMILVQKQDHHGSSAFIPTVDILLMWLTHQVSSFGFHPLSLYIIFSISYYEFAWTSYGLLS